MSVGTIGQKGANLIVPINNLTKQTEATKYGLSAPHNTKDLKMANKGAIS